MPRVLRAPTSTDVHSIRPSASVVAPPASSTPVARSRGASPLGSLEHALRVLLCPLDYPDPEVWGVAVSSALCELVDADAAALLLPAGAPFGAAARWQAVRRDAAEFEAYERTLRAHDLASDRMRELGLDVAHSFLLWAPRDIQRSDVWNEYIVPARMHDALGFRVRGVDGSLAGVCLHREHPRDIEVPAQHLALLGAVAPAFAAGVGVWQRLGKQRTELARVLDTLSDAVLLFDTAGLMLHENPVMARIGARGVDGERLRTEAQRLAWAVAALGRRATGGSAASVAAAVGEGPTREVRAAGVVYTLRGSIVSEGMLGREPTVLVTITAAARAPLSDAALRGRFRLTRRETEVARGIVDGLSNQELADRMGVSYFTARNHVERLLGKLGVGSRARVGPLLRDEIEC